MKTTTTTRTVPLLLKMTAARSLTMTAAREISREGPPRTVRLYEGESGRLIVRLDRDGEEPAAGWRAAYRRGELILPGMGDDHEGGETCIS